MSRRGRRRAPVLVLALVAACTLAGASGASGGSVPNLPWTDVLPPQASPSQTKPNRVAHCKRAKLKCVRFQIRRMRRLQEQLGCDHRAVFATTYLELTRELRDTLLADRNFFRFKYFFFREDALFANVYFRSIKAWDRGRPVAEAWRIAFETARDGEVNAGQDMLLGINAHVQNDMPFVLAALALRDRQGRSRKPDHDKGNKVLNSGYERVVRAVQQRFDPLISVTNASWSPIDDVAGLEVVRQWREQVWRNAERLVNAESDAEWAEVASSIEAYAGDWAEQIASPQQPGYRAQRDAYCRQQLGG
jgi:hypothetical protein